MAKQELVVSESSDSQWVMDVCRLVFDGLRLDKERARRLRDRRGEFQVGLRELIERFSTSDLYINEEVPSNYTYPPEYKGPKPIGEQVVALSEIFGLDPACALKYIKALPDMKAFVPEDALLWTGWFAVLAEDIVPAVANPAERYCQAVQLAIDKLTASRSFTNYRKGQIDPAHLRMHPRTMEFNKRIALVQKGPIRIIAAQLGMRHRGRSAQRARECFVRNEYGLNSLMGCSIALTHPERFVRWEELDMDLPGDEFSDDGDGSFGRVPCLYCSDDGLGFGTRSADNANGLYGSSSGFLPQ